MEYMKLDKEWLLGSVFGMNMCNYVDLLDEALRRKSRCREYSEEWFKEDITVQRHMARWDMARLALLSFYGIHYNFTRTSEYYGICNDDESDWLYKVERGEGMTCRDCIYYSKCIESSRMYVCIVFKKKEEGSNGIQIQSNILHANRTWRN